MSDVTLANVCTTLCIELNGLLCKFYGVAICNVYSVVLWKNVCTVTHCSNYIYMDMCTCICFETCLKESHFTTGQSLSLKSSHQCMHHVYVHVRVCMHVSQWCMFVYVRQIPITEHQPNKYTLMYS